MKDIKLWLINLKKCYYLIDINLTAKGCKLIIKKKLILFNTNYINYTLLKLIILNVYYCNNKI